MITGIILAAGRSTRMGRPKALLPHPTAGYTLVGHLVGTFRTGGVATVLVIGRPEDTALASAVAELDAQFVPNPDADRGQLSSLLTGLERLSADSTAALVSPVDVPLISPVIVAQLIDASATTPAVIVRPAIRGRHGHPVLFKRAIFDELRRADPRKGAREVVHADPTRVLDLEIEDEGVLLDVDTPGDYEHLMRPRLSGPRDNRQ